MPRSYLSVSLKPPRYKFDWRYRGQSGTIEADTRSEARAELKRRLGLKLLPGGIQLVRVERS